MGGESVSSLIASLPDSAPLCSLVIPGTHDTMTSACAHPYYRTQSLSLTEQLEQGARFLDIRLRSSMVAAHREWISDITAESILETLRGHLGRNPRDVILVRFQNANEAKDDFVEYGRALLPLIEADRDLFWTPPPPARDGATRWPLLGEARGRVVAFECAPTEFGLTRVHGEPWAVPWHGNPGIALQDDWDGPALRSKLSQVVELHRRGGRTGQLVLNHVSATNGEPGIPRAYAERLNPEVLTMLRERDIRGRGVLIFDFIDSELIDAAWRATLRGID
ncbi:hypothetical protein CHIBA101_1121 [Actinomyces sp. Chiba101]|uniref:1-phosphatidylinositol phosphodiesterase n=1 Tax=Actinomyces denticolens TaxID=52767 RepID=A0ABY1I4P8_9ACTO|nr:MULTISPECIES: hypothetical protein [Actinomyces]BAW92986.1 hypothetical protein CHIBA101_1121 [Actinomyces sp. Chiba101]GAV94030.1 hypothetical protein ADENT20671_0798 [Actinomyces denticolens]SHI59993.1 1-phosphatidylinositol phosphodiesterase [Actinomyces denticolens]SUU05782.1 1-phosphatidylinositol phosphodiesterase precursor [Actinomyces denticolens]